MSKRILVLGGGFAGVRCAQELGRAIRHGILPHETKVTLVSDRPYFEYHAALYRVVTGCSPEQVSIPLRDIFVDLPVSIVVDTISHVNLARKEVYGQESGQYTYDYLVMALGSETTYFNIPGLEKYSFGFKSTNEALKLRQHFEAQLCACVGLTPTSNMPKTRVVIVGGGASGVELAAELAGWLKELAIKNQVPPSCVAIDLVEAAPRLLPQLSPRVSALVEPRIRSLGVNVYLNRAITSKTEHEAVFSDMAIKSQTLVWTAGVTPNRVYKDLQIEKDKRGRIVVDDQLCVKTAPEVFVAGDAAATKYSGMASTAVRDGDHIAQVIIAKERNWSIPKYVPKPAPYIIPVGPGWAVYSNTEGTVIIKGIVGWWLRRIFDMAVYKLFLPVGKAVHAFRS